MGGKRETRQLGAMGFKPGEASPCCFCREEDDVCCVVHGDDFTFEGPPKALEEVTASLKEVWLIKVRAMLGPEAKDDKEVSILNRVIRWTEDALLYEAGPRHVESSCEMQGWRIAARWELQELSNRLIWTSRGSKERVPLMGRSMVKPVDFCRPAWNQNRPALRQMEALT